MAGNQFFRINGGLTLVTNVILSEKSSYYRHHILVKTSLLFLLVSMIKIPDRPTFTDTVTAVLIISFISYEMVLDSLLSENCKITSNFIIIQYSYLVYKLRKKKHCMISVLIIYEKVEK